MSEGHDAYKAWKRLQKMFKEFGLHLFRQIKYKWRALNTTVTVTRSG